MNRLVIIGNGFDLAHGLPTGYCDFIDDYWKKVFSELSGINTRETITYDDNLLSFEVIMSSLYTIKALDAYKKVSNYTEFKKFLEDKDTYQTKGFNYKLKFKNRFFEILNDKNYIQNWVDIENEYYQLLKGCLNEEQNIKVRKLNEEFHQIKVMLENYLHNEVILKYDYSEEVSMSHLIGIFDLNNRINYQDKFLMEFAYGNQEEIRNYLKHKSILSIKKGTEKNLFLNFNYTPTVDLYAEIMNSSWRDDYGHCEVIQIHGRLKAKENPINFGFGDEMDDEYKTIEKKDDNEYLRNIKSFQYLQTSNYRRMLNFVESNSFQVYIMGHSCGLSDRILLNKIFEHKNCLSIKVFYYKSQRGDNYTELIQNISRHFNKKEMMREKIVNKTLCEPLPQMQLPLKEIGPQ